MSTNAIERKAETAYEAAFRASMRAPEAKEAFARFVAAGLPTRRVESWHYTDLRQALAAPAPFAAQPDTDRIAEVRSQLGARLAPTRFVLVDGRFAPELSDDPPEGAAMRGGAPRLGLDERDDPMIAFAGAFAEGGFSFEVQDEAEIGAVEIVHALRPGVASASHVSFYFLPGARGAVVERVLGAAHDAQRHRLATFELCARAKVEHTSILDDGAGVEIESLRVALGEGATFASFGLITAPRLARRQIFARLEGPEASIALSGLSLIEGRRHADTTLEVVHAAPRGQSREFYRHIVADEATGVFQGKVVVKPGAQKTDGGMKSQAILLSPHATMDAKPELEIFADDVVCGHGATVGALDPEQLFYLRARGLEKAEAEAMLLEAFAAEAIARVADPALAEALLTMTRAWLARRGQGRPA